MNVPQDASQNKPPQNHSQKSQKKCKDAEATSFQNDRKDTNTARCPIGQIIGIEKKLSFN
jgi:hypothetical protein